MLRHEFRPGKLIAGLFLTAAGVVYLGDAGDAWQTPWFAVIPLVIGGLCLAGAVGLLNLAIRGRGRGPGERKGPPAPPGFESGAAAGSAGTAKHAGTAGSAGAAGADPGGATGPSGSAG
ncbi:hypothetical protein SsS58_01260 [Streptomyces scabiei]|uniref:Uncharacterized protein n=1 Tax=Streptomyces scabiei TaxID=1930 RepID=A0A100JJW7_STRSC|nr:hypothetical protein SsS58_01260 [Streptomyces scabiei]